MVDAMLTYVRSRDLPKDKEAGRLLSATLIGDSMLMYVRSRDQSKDGGYEEVCKQAEQFVTHGKSSINVFIINKSLNMHHNMIEHVSM